MKNKIKHPSNSIISVYVDNELDSNSKEFKHILNCKKCQKVVNMYVNIEKAVKEGIKHISKEITGRIKKGVQNRLNLIKFNSNTEISLLDDEELKWVAGGTQQEPEDPYKNRNK